MFKKKIFYKIRSFEFQQIRRKIKRNKKKNVVLYTIILKYDKV